MSEEIDMFYEKDTQGHWVRDWTPEEAERLPEEAKANLVPWKKTIVRTIIPGVSAWELVWHSKIEGAGFVGSFGETEDEYLISIVAEFGPKGWRKLPGVGVMDFRVKKSEIGEPPEFAPIPEHMAQALGFSWALQATQERYSEATTGAN